MQAYFPDPEVRQMIGETISLYQPGQAIIDTLTESELAPQIVERLYQHPEAIEALNNMSPAEARRQLTRLEGAIEAEQREFAAAFAALGPDSHIADYLPYLHDHAFAEQALRGIQKVKTRQSDAVALLEQRHLAELGELWQFNVLPTRDLCAAYGTALTTAAKRVTKARSDYLSAAIDLEWQLPNIKWLVSAKCDLSGPLERAETNVRAVADSDRMTNFAHTLADLKGIR